MLNGYVNFPRKIMERIEKGESNFTEPGIFKELTEMLELNKPLIVNGNTGAGIVTAHLNVIWSPNVIYAAATLYLNSVVTMKVTITSNDNVSYAVLT